MLTLYYGTDAWRLRHASQLFADGWREAHGTSPLIVDGSSPVSTDALERLLKYPSFFQQRAAAVVHRPLEASGMGDILRSGPDDTDILLVQRTAPKQTIEHKKAMSVYVKLADTVEIFEPLTGTTLAAWVREFVAAGDRTIEPAAIAELTGRAGNESWNLANELEKLCAYVPSTVTIEAVRQLVRSGHRHDEWELSNAIAACDKRAAVSALFRRVREGTPEQLLVGMLASAVRTLLMVRDLTDRGRPAAAIATITGLHPYVVSKTVRGAALYQPAQLRTAHRALAKLDRSIKEGNIDATDGLFSVLLGL